MGEIDPKKLEEKLARDDPAAAPRVRARSCSPTTACPSCPPTSSRHELLGWTAATATPQVEVALKHPKVKLIANALGTPPQDVIEQHPRVAAGWSPRSAARVQQALTHKAGGRRHRHRAGHRGRRPHRRDRQHGAVARGDRRGGADAGARGGRHRHGPADRGRARDGRAGRVDRLALAHRRGGRGAARADGLATCTRPATTRCARARGPGKPCRMLRNDWTEAWEEPEDARSRSACRSRAWSRSEAIARTHRYADRPGAEGRVQPGRPDRRPMNEVRSRARGDLQARRGVRRLGGAPAGHAGGVAQGAANGPVTQVSSEISSWPSADGWKQSMADTSSASKSVVKEVSENCQ